MKNSAALVCLVLGIVLGWGGSAFLSSSDTGEGDLSTDSSSEPGISVSAHEEQMSALGRSLAAVKADLHQSREAQRTAELRTAQLEEEVASLRSWKEKYEDLVKASAGQQKERLAAIEKRFAALKVQGLAALVSSNEIGKLVADLLQIGEAGHEAVLALLKSEDESEQMLGLVLMLQGMAGADSVDPLKDLALNGEDDTMRALASQALMRMDGREAIPALENIVANSRDEGVRVNSLYGLARQGHKEGIRQLLEYYTNPESRFADSLNNAFLMLKNPDAQPLVDAVVDRFKDRDEAARERVGLAAVRFYKQAGTPEARQALQQIVADPSSSNTLRQAAQDALNN